MGFALFTIFIIWPLVEIVMLVLVADWVGWGWALFGLVGLSFLGVLVIRGTFRAAREIASSNASPEELPRLGTQAADAGLRFLAGVLLLVPGYFTGLIGLLLLLPPIRSLTRAAVGNAVVRRFPTMQATFTRVRVVTPPGDVVQGEVIRDDDPRNPPRDPGRSDPPALP
jgi:UPF0716 protein FxsA